MKDWPLSDTNTKKSYFWISYMQGMQLHTHMQNWSDWSATLCPAPNTTYEIPALSYGDSPCNLCSASLRMTNNDVRSKIIYYRVFFSGDRLFYSLALAKLAVLKTASTSHFQLGSHLNQSSFSSRIWISSLISKVQWLKASPLRPECLRSQSWLCHFGQVM